METILSKKILIVTEVLPPKYGGADIAAFRYAEFMHKEKPGSVLLMGEWNTEITPYLNKNSFILPVKVKKYISSKWRFKRLLQILNWLITYYKVKKVMRKYNHCFDVVHSFNSWSDLNLASVSIGKTMGKKVITETCLIGADDPAIILRQVPKDWFSVNFYRRKAYLRSDRFVSKSPYMTKIFNDLLPNNKIIEVPYFVDIKNFKPISDDQIKILRKKHIIDINDKVILYVGGINPRKGVSILIKAIQCVKQLHPNIKLILAGPFGKDEKYNSEIKEVMRKLGGSIIHFNERIDFVCELMQIADFYCLPSFKEGFPISIIEALCTGIPVLASDIPEIHGPQIKNGINGLTFVVGDANDLKDKIVKAISFDQITLDNYRTQALKIRKIYSIDRISKNYISIYLS